MEDGMVLPEDTALCSGRPGAAAGLASLLPDAELDSKHSIARFLGLRVRPEL
jgi:hypothetical protein